MNAKEMNAKALIAMKEVSLCNQIAINFSHKVKIAKRNCCKSRLEAAILLIEMENFLFSILGNEKLGTGAVDECGIYWDIIDEELFSIREMISREIGECEIMIGRLPSLPDDF